ncbi:MAG: asparagine synthase (glutamine-hydrolyzing) [Deltaproteobacteria bacterium]|nr:asparagine synthase (glutamine-hydrolyzing) [Deltaproteobacteria bacterium]
MCGITGMFSSGGAVLPLAALQPMNQALLHRGPDEEGSFHDDVVGLAMRRLSIIGLGNGRQPIFNEDGSVGVIMNGEIYNYQELRAGLEERGHHFRTRSDIEVAVHLYEEQGTGFVSALRGMFAFALYDQRQRRLLLGRDRLGKKPLYYAEQGGILYFASEIKALHASGRLPQDLDTGAFESYLAHGFVVGPRTLFSGIRKLPPASILEASRDGIKVRPYWDLPAPQNTDMGFDQAAEKLRVLLEEAVHIRLMSEVPLGAFLSGGVDSSAVVGIMSRASVKPVETFAVGFDNPDFDELVHARTAAQLYGTNHHELVLRQCSPDLLREINFYHDEPAADPAAVPTYCLSRFARAYVTVVLTGEGGDELFAGYRHYRLHRQLAQWEDRYPGIGVAARVLAGLEPLGRSFGPRRLWKAVWIANLPRHERPRGLVSVFTDGEVKRLLSTAAAADGGRYAIDEFRALQARVRNLDCVSQAMYVDAKTQLADQLLMKVDKTTMAASLEARCPFLDQKLIEYVASLPIDMKISDSGAKLLLRQALRGLVPDELLDRPKHGFEVPVRRWMLSELEPLANEVLLAPGAGAHQYLRADAVKELWQRLRSHDDAQVARQAWTLLNFAVWYEQLWGRNRRGVEHVECVAAHA